MTSANVRRAHAGDADAISALLARAFANYAWTRWTVDSKNHEARVAALQRLALTELVLPFGEAWVATDEADDVVSAAMWMRPDVSVPVDVWAHLAPITAELEGTRHAASVAAEALCTPFRPSAPHYYLGAVGTLPSHQRRGFAAAALRPVLDRTEPAFLETCGPENVAFYTALGFRVTAEVTVPSGGPTVSMMQR